MPIFKRASSLCSKKFKSKNSIFKYFWTSNLHFFVGETIVSLAPQFGMGDSTACYIIAETCRAIITVLAERFLKTPNTEEEWKVGAPITIKKPII